MNRIVLALSVLLLLPIASLAAGKPPTAVATQIDSIIDKALSENKVPSSAQADDAEFLRRVTLDITGRIPTRDRTIAFLADTQPDKRAKLIDELLADGEYGEHFATIWYYRMIRLDDDNRYLVKDNKLQDWLTSQFNNNRTWNQIVTDLLMASGNKNKNPEVTFYLAHVDDNKKHFEPAPNKIVASASKLFMGVRLECCECHNHPFNTLKQNEFWGVAAFFSELHGDQTSRKELKEGMVPGIHEGGVANKKAKTDNAPFGAIEIPDSKGKTVRAKYLGGPEAVVSKQASLRKPFVSWLTGPKNKYFATAAVNKLWANFFGRGLSNPVDDIDLEKVTHPDLLKLLAEEFTASGFDQKHLIRCICNSQAYQRTSAVLPANKSDNTLYSHMRVKVMSADMLYDSLQEVLGHGVAEKSKGAGKKGGGGAREQFRAFFHAEADDDVGVVEDYNHGVPQVLRLMNAAQLNDTAKTVTALMKSGTPENVIESLYLTVLSRQPTSSETKKMKDYAATEKFSAKVYGDLLWVLLNSGEFVFNH